MPAYLQLADGPWLSLLVLSPLVGILLIGLGGALRLPLHLTRWGALAWSLVPLGMAIFVWTGFNPTLTSDGGRQSVLQFVELLPWINAIKVDYFLGVDGISLPLVLLTTVMTPVALVASFGVQERARVHFALLLLLEAAMLGYFVALDFFFFFLFWEFSLVPAFFLVQHWGRDPQQRRGAALQFFVYTMAGSIGMLLLFQVLYVATAYAGQPTFNLITLGRLGQSLPTDGYSANLQTILFNFLDTTGITNALGRFPLLYSSIAFWAVFVAFAIKLAVWPFHTWLPDTYTEAPTAGSILLAGVMSKMGAYGMLRILLPFFPQAAQQFGPLMGALALIGIITGAFNALYHVRGDAKRLIAYTSINHMGYVALGIAATATYGSAPSVESRAIALNGVVMQLVAHGLSTGALFLLVGALADRTGTTSLADWGGLRRAMPLFAGLFGVAMFANLGLPGLAGFVGEFFIFRGVWPTLPLQTLLATIGLVVTALALLRMYSAIFHGPPVERWASLPDLPLRSHEVLAVLPLLVLLLALGLYPAPLLDICNSAANALASAFIGVFS